MSSGSVLRCAALGALLSGCPAVTTEAPPPPTKPEIAMAPPRARGAFAAGTDAAPAPEAEPGALPVFPAPSPGAAPSTGGPKPDVEVSPPEPADAGVPL